jgi:hypothetical protein
LSTPSPSLLTPSEQKTDTDGDGKWIV